MVLMVDGPDGRWRLHLPMHGGALVAARRHPNSAAAASVGSSAAAAVPDSSELRVRS